ncbi:hypothetical protein [Limosilactobacillus reuteri]|uniref:hypothetical protein n=1 Tax=Limosilactobacillus reuteri TaxID=1598 RepID=UPI001E4703B9|nr:hypothetical protein [Limosilactobacillus reuteri]MCC4503179.1 hypothetical protein [Limosilactobacillus reuteri]
MQTNFENIENAHIKRAFLFNSRRRRLLKLFKHNPAHVFVLVLLGNDQRELPLLIWPDSRDGNTRELCAQLKINLDSDFMANNEQVRAAILTRRLNAHWKDSFDLSVKMTSCDSGWTSATVQITNVERGDALNVANAKFDYLVRADGKIVKHKQDLKSILKPEYLKACGISIHVERTCITIVRNVDARRAGLNEEKKMTATEKEKLAKMLYTAILHGEDCEREYYKVRKFNCVRNREYDRFYEIWKKIKREVD